MSSTQIGYTLSSEEHPAKDLVENATYAEDAGFAFASISDHFSPWTNTQGQSPFVWTVLGALSQATNRIPIITGVTCPILRIHPVIIAQAAATTASLFDGRFLFGVGTGENLNEHVVGLGWPNINTRQGMLREAIEIIRQLWTGELTDIQGAYFRVDQAKIYSLPDKLPPILISALGPRSAILAGEIGDGLVTTSPKETVISQFRESGGEGKPVYAQATVCYDQDEASAKETAAKFWPTSAVEGQASQELPMPLHFEQAAKDVTPEKIASSIVCGPDKQRHIDQIQKYIDGGVTHVYIHQVGPNQKEFIDFYAKEILPEFV